MTHKRVLLLGVAVLLSVTALLAVAILLVGRFGSTEGRILGSTALLAGYGLVALPAIVLLDGERARPLALAGAALAALGAVLALVSIWSGVDSDTLGRTVGSVAVFAVACAQVCALTARRAAADPVSVTRLFAVSCFTAGLAAVLGVTLVWTSPHGGVAPRILGAVVVLDLLVVALQPVLVRARPRTAVHRFEIALVSGERIEVEVLGGDLASAAARAIRSVEHERGSVAELEVRRQDARTHGSPA